MAGTADHLWGIILAGGKSKRLRPSNRETGPGILLPLLHVYQRDPKAVVVLLPADHFIPASGNGTEKESAIIDVCA